jgi:hypothetical protein
MLYVRRSIYLQLATIIISGRVNIGTVAAGLTVIGDPKYFYCSWLMSTFSYFFLFIFTFPTFLDRCLLGTLALPVAFALPPTIWNIFPPHTVHIPDMPLRPSFAFTRFSSFILRLTLHFTQYPSVVNL